MDHIQKMGGLGSLVKVEGGNLEEVGNKNHLPQGLSLVVEDTRVMVVVEGFDMMEIADGLFEGEVLDSL